MAEEKIELLDDFLVDMDIETITLENVNNKDFIEVEEAEEEIGISEETKELNGFSKTQGIEIENLNVTPAGEGGGGVTISAENVNIYQNVSEGVSAGGVEVKPVEVAPSRTVIKPDSVSLEIKDAQIKIDESELILNEPPEVKVSQSEAQPEEISQDEELITISEADLDAVVKDNNITDLENLGEQTEAEMAFSTEETIGDIGEDKALFAGETEEVATIDEIEKLEEPTIPVEGEVVEEAEETPVQESLGKEEEDIIVSIDGSELDNLIYGEEGISKYAQAAFQPQTTPEMISEESPLSEAVSEKVTPVEYEEEPQAFSGEIEEVVIEKPEEIELTEIPTVSETIEQELGEVQAEALVEKVIEEVPEVEISKPVEEISTEPTVEEAIEGVSMAEASSSLEEVSLEGIEEIKLEEIPIEGIEAGTGTTGEAKISSVPVIEKEEAEAETVVAMPVEEEKEEELLAPTEVAQEELKPQEEFTFDLSVIPDVAEVEEDEPIALSLDELNNIQVSEETMEYQPEISAEIPITEEENVEVPLEEFSQQSEDFIKEPASLEVYGLEEGEHPSEELQIAEVEDLLVEPKIKGISETGEIAIEEKIEALSPETKEELRTVLKYLDNLLENLPEDKIKEFAKSEYYDLYIKILDKLGI
ncbi:MAG: hypothetical protein ACP5QT_01565 [Brevinematia bacterium]